MRVPRFLAKLIPGFEVTDVKEWLDKGYIEVFLRPFEKEFNCAICDHLITRLHSQLPVRIRHLPIMQFPLFVCFDRRRGHCPGCKKIRSERVDFIAAETPHLSQDFAWWLGRVCESTPVTKVADLFKVDDSTLWRVDFERMKRMFQHYKIPKVTRISVDEVYARKFRKGFRTNRDKCFFTIVCDLDSRRVIWVSESRSQEALDEFFKIIGPERCEDIELVVGDQHDAYSASTRDFCPNADFVWDRFHLVQSMERAFDETRKAMLEDLTWNTETKRLARGKWKYVFMMKASRRSSIDKEHVEQVFSKNEKFFKLELIKERFLTMFEAKDELEGEFILTEIGDWIKQCRFKDMQKWFDNLMKGWKTLKNWFKHRVTSSLSEGQNNVIKALKRRGFGYRNMAYFKLKILQVCGFLNSNYIKSVGDLSL